MPELRLQPNASPELRDIVNQLNNILQRFEFPTRPVKLPRYSTFDNLPDARQFANSLAFVEDVRRVAYSDMTRWFYLEDTLDTADRILTEGGDNVLTEDSDFTLQE